MSDVFDDLEQRYLDAVDRRRAVMDAWERDGRPLLSTGSTGQLREHPLVEQLNELDRLCHLLAKPLMRTQRPGRPPVATPSTITESPASIRRREVAVRRAS